MEWTKEQKEAITLTGKNILVSAAAGSGKTTILVERIKNLILKEGADIDRFLITTFTKAAAAEMKERLEKAIREEMQKPEADRQALLRQLQKLPSANISTFHSFAIEIIKQYFYLINIEPGFTIADEIQAELMKKEAVDKAFAGRYAEDYETFKEFVMKYGSARDDKKLREAVLSTFRTMVSIPDYFKWAREKAEIANTEDPMEAMGAYEFIAENTVAVFTRAADLLADAAELIDDTASPFLKEKADADAEKTRDLSQRAASDFARNTENLKESLEQFAELAFPYKTNNLRPARKKEEELDEETKGAVERLRNEAKKIVNDLNRTYYNKTFDVYNQDIKDVYEDTKYYIELIADFEKNYRELKAEAKVIDFDDVMHYALEVLKHEEAAEELREKFRYIFIDEYQDSNFLQEEIVGRIASGDNLFMVGDVKQCIYKFRLAEPELFMDKAEKYRKSEVSNSTLINLNSNFRSKKNVTGPVNEIFRRVMTGYDSDAELHCTAPDERPGMPARIHIVDKSRHEEGRFDDSEAEGAVIARIIRSHLGKKVYDTKRGEERELTLKDFAVIARTNRTVEDIERYLINEGIDAYGSGSGKYFETVEVQVFINLLRIIVNKRQDVPLISAMRSVVFGFSVKDLVEIRINSRKGSFYSAVKEYIQRGKDETLRQKLTDMFEQIARWKEISRTVPLEELMKKLLYDTGYYDYCSGLPVGVQRIANLRIISEKAAKYEKISHGGLFGFLKYIESMSENDKSEAEAQIIGENEDVVRIMSVHKSKGLEFPVVIFANASKSLKYREKDKMPIHKEYGIGLPRVNRSEHWHRKTFIEKMINATKEREYLEEEVRILYVALTRAKDCLEIVATVPSTEKLPEEVSKKTYLDMVYETFVDRNETEVIIEDPVQLKDETTAEARSTLMLRREIGQWEKDRLEPDRIAEIDRRLNFQYKYGDETSVKPKYSVSELNKKRTGEVEDSTLRPSEIPLSDFVPHETVRGLSFARIGTVMHLLMEKADYRRACESGREYLQQVADMLLAAENITTEEYDSINVEKGESFFKSEVGRRAAEADARGKLFKEKEFILKKQINGADTVVQGIIDCFFEEDGKLILVDFKNSYTGGSRSVEDIKESYRGQIELYADALKGATGMEVSERYLFLFDTGKVEAL